MLLKNTRQIQTGIVGKIILMPVLVLHRMVVFLMESMPKQSISPGKIPSPNTHIHYFGDSSKSVLLLETKYRAILFGKSYLP
ncbi:hypothetical protein OIU85_010351 [Salix viminalis]|uniref:Uncharacterized protein n=1 Tax=Salix viminalis TaxID=40686 RepID=A0A9Q0NWG5_SALVM|nr:hypothetical protein OIU85_010351 [Salix viminalis]